MKRPGVGQKLAYERLPCQEHNIHDKITNNSGMPNHHTYLRAGHLYIISTTASKANNIDGTAQSARLNLNIWI